jgi:protein-disulfide isomerase
MDMARQEGALGSQDLPSFRVLSVTRRKLARRVWLLAVASAAFATAGELTVIGPTRAEDISVETLMNPGPLADVVLGSKNGPVIIIEYASMTCPHCAAFAIETFPELKTRYIDTGKVRYIFREFPIDDLAAAASMLARCAGDERYFDVVETLLRQQNDWVEERIQPLMTFATKHLGFTNESFNACLTDTQLFEHLKNARKRASDIFKVSSTPTFFVNGKKQSGYKSIKEMTKLIEPYLRN